MQTITTIQTAPYFPKKLTAEIAAFNAEVNTLQTARNALMQDAADDLDMQLEVLYGERDNEVILRNARQVLASPHKPDYLIFVNEQYLGPEILRMFADSGIRLFAVHSSLTDEQQ